MGTTQDHRRYAQECVAMARLSEGDNDKVLWLALAQSWVRLAEHVDRAQLTLVPAQEAEEIGDARLEDAGEMSDSRLSDGE